MNLSLAKIASVVYRGTDYALWFSSAAGLTNGCIEARHSNNFNHAFGDAFIHNFEMGFFVSQAYPVLIDYLAKTNHARLYSNAFHLSMIAALFTWHSFSGTQNPAYSMIPSLIVGTLKVNKEISDRNTIDEKVV